MVNYIVDGSGLGGYDSRTPFMFVSMDMAAVLDNTMGTVELHSR